jgi:DNA-directed RNA polymerase specialized sigma24 family protein
MAKEQSIPGTHDSFASLLAALGDSPSAAGQHYEQLRAKLIFFFTRKALEVPEDLADEVLDRLGRRLSEGLAILSVDAFALGVARHVAQEQSAARNRVEAVDPAFFHNVPAVSTTFSEDERIVYLERCLRRLPSFDSQLLKGYYLSDGGSAIRARKNMADRLGISPGTLRQKVFLIRKRLLECVTARLEKRKSE